ncbi:MAG TPA: hypothetical protein VEA44_03920 [Caulobacter sp.]|nr:hypothetical protein [Caulobacter sp.]
MISGLNRARSPGDVGCDLHPSWEGAFIPTEHWHFHSQLFKRYGLILAPGEFSWMLRQIANGKAILVQKKAKGGSIYCVKVPSTWDKIYVAAEGHRIITAMTPSRRLNQMRKAALASRDAERLATQRRAPSVRPELDETELLSSVQAVPVHDQSSLSSNGAAQE